MKTIELKVKKLFGIRSFRVDFPERISEMTERQFVALVALSRGSLSVEEFYASFLGVDTDLLRELDGYALWMLGGLFERLDRQRGVDGVSSFFIPRLRVYHSPDEKLHGMSFQQFMMIDTYSSWYTVSGRAEYLDQMIAAMYLKEGYSYFPEKDETLVDFDTSIEDLSQIHIDVKMAVFINWNLIRQWLSATFPYLFPKGDGNDAKGGNAAAWLDIFDAFVGDNIPHMDEYKKLPCMDAFRILNRKIKNSK